MTRDDLIARTKTTREYLNTFYQDLKNLHPDTALLAANLSATNGYSIAEAMIHSSRHSYEALMKTGSILGYLGEENPYPKDTEEGIGPSLITGYSFFPVYAETDTKKVQETVAIVIKDVKSVRISLQETILALDLFPLDEIENRKARRLYDALIVNLISAKHWLGVVLGELREPVYVAPANSISDKDQTEWQKGNSDLRIVTSDEKLPEGGLNVIMGESPNPIDASKITEPDKDVKMAEKPLDTEL